MIASIVLMLSSLVAAIDAAHAQAPQTTPLKVSVGTGPALPLGQAAERWVALLADSSDPRLVAKLYPGAALADREPARELIALKEGKADLAVGSALRWSLHEPSLGVFALPWIAPENRDLEALVASGPLRDALRAKLDARDVVLVALAPLGHREIATTARPIRSPDDVKGLRLRAVALPLVHDLLLALGALPQAMSFAEAQAAFAKGALDGQEERPTALAAARAHASGQRHLTDWGAMADAMVFAVRKPLWEGLTAEQREAVARAARQAIDATQAIAREETAVRQLAQNGVAVVRITAAGHAAFRDAAKGVAARWRETVGGDIVTLAEKAVAEARTAPRKPSQ